MALREASEARAAAAEGRYRTLVERVPIVAYSWDSAFGPGTAPADYISPQIETLLGVPAEAWLEDPEAWAAHVHPDDLERVESMWNDATAAAAAFSAEYRVRRADGVWRWVRDDANPIGQGAHGSPIYQGVIVDITERHRAEESLRAQERRWRSLLEDLPMVAYEVAYDADGAILDHWVAHGIEELLGTTIQAWNDDDEIWERSIHPDDRALVLSQWAALRDGGTPFDMQYRMRRGDGEVVWVHDRAVRNEREGRAVIQGAFADVTGRMQAEAALELAEERFRTLVEQLPVAVYTDAVDERSTALYISPQYEALTGYSPQQRMGEQDLWTRMLHPDDRDRVLAESAMTNATGEPFDTEYRIVAADGRTVWLHDHAVLVADANGDKRWHGVLQDVTQQHAAAEAIARRDAILEATSFAAEHFLRAGSWLTDLPEVLARLGKAGDSTRCAVFANHTLEDGALGVSIVASWPPEAETLVSADADRDFAWEAGGFDRWVAELGSGRPIHGSVDTFPERERAYLSRGPMVVRSLVAVPIFVEGDWWLHQLRPRRRGPRMARGRRRRARADGAYDRRRDRARPSDRALRGHAGAVSNADRTDPSGDLHRGCRNRRRGVLQSADAAAPRLRARRMGHTRHVDRRGAPGGPRARARGRRAGGFGRASVPLRVPAANRARRLRLGS